MGESSSRFSRRRRVGAPRIREIHRDSDFRANQPISTYDSFAGFEVAVMVTQGNPGKWRTFALSMPSRCSWSSSDVLRALCRGLWAPGRWRALLPPTSSRPPAQSSLRIVTSWWKLATRWRNSIALDPPHLAPVDLCPC